MQVDAAKPRMVHGHRADFLTERDHHHQIRGGKRLSIDVCRFGQGKAQFDCQRANRSGCHFFPTPGRAIGLGVDVDDLVTGGDQGAQRGDAEFTAAGEDDLL